MGRLFDERYVLHRYKATSHSAMVAAIVLGGLYIYDLAAHGTTRWDLLLVLAAMAVTKLSFMLYFRLRD